jgi:heat shock protein HslJ
VFNYAHQGEEMKKNIVNITTFVVLSLVLILTACTPKANSIAVEDAEWVLDTLGPAEMPAQIPAGIEITLQLNSADQNAGGSSGCNSYFASYELAGSSLTFSEIGSTLMACEEEGVMETEMAYLTALGQVSEYAVEEDTLTLTTEDNLVLFFRKR